MNKRVMAIVAHPDDEIIGIGGTLAKHINEGYDVSIIVMSEGRSSRLALPELYDQTMKEQHQFETHLALERLGINNCKFMGLAGNRMDRYDLLDIIKIIEIEICLYKPSIVYTHNFHDLNIDHTVVSKAVITATRPLPDNSVDEILFFETLSSTESALGFGQAFCPNLFINITTYLEQKLYAMEAYRSELRELPHPRNIECIRKNAELWGSKVGIEAAEAFVVSRIIR